jgi:membrane-bound lytic murein transglycosylase D
MPRIISILGVALLICSACLPHTGFLPAKAVQESLPLVRETPSLFTGFELEEFLSPGVSPPLFSEVSIGDQFSKNPELPISEEGNDDLDLITLPEKSPDPEPKFDIPIVMNEKVEQFLQFFQTSAKNTFSGWLSRSEKYVTFMRKVLRENGLPEDLVYLVLIESGFNPYAYSRSKASGLWQFILPTGKRYGLKVNWWVDERRDPEKSTVAAAKYLKDLYDMFECWYLATAGYNAGENKILNAMKRYRTEDFWELAKYRYLKQETRDYVPQMIAAALIAKDPEKYGFTGIEYQEPLRYERVKVPRVTDLRDIAKASKITVEELKDLNPELLRGRTPPDSPEYEIRIPVGKKEFFTRNFEPDPNLMKFRFKTHIVKKKETLSGIAKAYRVKLAPLLEINQLSKKSRLSAGMNLLIPIPVRRESITISTSGKVRGKKERGRDYSTFNSRLIMSPLVNPMA